VKKTSNKKISVLRRYTSLPALLHLLHNKQITLLSPASWDDKNDAFFMSEYKRCQEVKSVLALCFSEANETYHHWRVFTDGSDGVCVEFKRDELLAAFDTVANIRKRAVQYKLMTKLKNFHPSVGQLPFLKRQPYKDEKEFRLVYVDGSEEIAAKGFYIDLTCIQRITLNPWMPKPLADAVKLTIHSIDGCKSVEVYQTTLLENERWKAVARRCGHVDGSIGDLEDRYLGEARLQKRRAPLTSRRVRKQLGLGR
jgi:hypothetical protein